MNEDDIKNLDQRLTKLEEWRILVDIARAREEVDKEYIKQQFKELQTSLKQMEDKFQSMSSRVVWAIATPVITTIVVAVITRAMQ